MLHFEILSQRKGKTKGNSENNENHKVVGEHSRLAQPGAPPCSGTEGAGFPKGKLEALSTLCPPLPMLGRVKPSSYPSQGNRGLRLSVGFA